MEYELLLGFKPTGRLGSKTIAMHGVLIFIVEGGPFLPSDKPPYQVAPKTPVSGSALAIS
jgi:hypothetical protein